MRVSFEHKVGVKIYTKLMEEIERFERELDDNRKPKVINFQRLPLKSIGSTTEAVMFLTLRMERVMPMYK